MVRYWSSQSWNSLRSWKLQNWSKFCHLPWHSTSQFPSVFWTSEVGSPTSLPSPNDRISNVTQFCTINLPVTSSIVSDDFKLTKLLFFSSVIQMESDSLATLKVISVNMNYFNHIDRCGESSQINLSTIRWGDKWTYKRYHSRCITIQKRDESWITNAALIASASEAWQKFSLSRNWVNPNSMTLLTLKSFQVCCST
jgi:hypothetical protein